MAPAPGTSKLTDSSALEKLMRENPEKKFILTGGTFDILKPAHIDLIEFASNRGDLLITAVREEGIYTPLEERLEILNEVEKIDYLLTFSGKFTEITLLDLCSGIVTGEEFQLADTGTPHFEKTIVFPR